MIDQQTEATLLEFINSTPAMQSLLYDLGMLPEEIMARTGAAYRDNPDWRRMLMIGAAWKAQQVIWEPEQ